MFISRGSEQLHTFAAGAAAIRTTVGATLAVGVALVEESVLIASSLNDRTEATWTVRSISWKRRLLADADPRVENCEPARMPQIIVSAVVTTTICLIMSI